MAKLNFQKLLRQSSVSHDPEWNQWFGAQVKLIIITNVENSCAA